MTYRSLSKILLFATSFTTWSDGSMVTYRKITDTLGTLPAAGTWAGFYNPAISSGKVAFLAYKTNFSPLSLFAEFNQGIVHVASDGDIVPVDGRRISQGFTTDSFPVYNGGRIYWEVTLIADSNSSRGVLEYTNSGLRVAFDQLSVNAYAGSTLSWYAYHNLMIGSNGRVVRALSGPGGTSGSYLWLIGYDGTGLSIINNGTSLPPSTTRFTQDYAIYHEGFAIYNGNQNPKFLRDHLGTNQTIDTGLTEFLAPEVLHVTDQVYGNGRWFGLQGRLYDPGLGTTTHAILGWSAGKWFKVIRAGDTTEDGTVITYLSDISAPRNSLHKNSLLFTAGTANGDSIFLFRNGTVKRILKPGDFIEGRQVLSVSIGPNSLEDDLFCFVVQFTDGVKAVYLGDVSDMYPTSTLSLISQITTTAPHVGTITFPTEQNKTYHVFQSDDLQRSTIIKSTTAESALGLFTFDNRAENPKRRFYWIEESTYHD